jgi:hypothetical protein
MATSGPYESILARGFAYREASDNPRRPIIVVGILLIFVPVLIGCAGTLCVMAAELFSRGIQGRELPSTMVGLLFVVGGVYVSWKMITKTLHNYLRQKREALAETDSDEVAP